jgi:hypothetical protein
MVSLVASTAGTASATGSCDALIIESPGELIIRLDSDGSAVEETEATQLSPDIIVDALNAGRHVIVRTIDEGTIEIASDIRWTTDVTLSIRAHGDIVIGATVVNTGGGSLSLRADSAGTGIGTVLFTDSGSVKLSGGSGNVNIFYNPPAYDQPVKFGSRITVEGGTLTAYMLVNDLDDLLSINLNRHQGQYALGRDIDARVTSTWTHEDGRGWRPIATFGGLFDGQGHVIDGLFIERPEKQYTGLFDVIASTGVVRNLRLENVEIKGARQSGGLAGLSRGTVERVSVSGSVSGTSYVGGLIGQNRGVVRECFNSGAVTGSENQVGGLLGDNWAGEVIQCYSTASVAAGGYNVGGLIGLNRGLVRESYSAGRVEGTSSRIGGLVGSNSDEVVSAYWNVTTSGQSEDVAGTGITSAQMSSPAFWAEETDWDIDFTGERESVWRLYEDDPAPRLKAFDKPEVGGETLSATHSSSISERPSAAPSPQEQPSDDETPPRPSTTREPGQLRAMRGELVPKMLSPNLLANGDFHLGLIGWSLVEQEGGRGSLSVVETEYGPVLQLEKENDGVVQLVSDPIPVTPNYQYQVTCLYHTHTASFGNMAEFTLVEVSDPSRPAQADVPKWRPSVSATLGHRTLFNSPVNEWRRKTRVFTVSSRARFARLVLTVEGPPVTLLLDNVYFSVPNESSRPSVEHDREMPTSLSQARSMLLEGRRRLDARGDSSAVVQTVDGIPRLFVDGQPAVPQIHMGDVSNPARSYFRQFGEHNVRVHIVQVRDIWVGHRNYNLAAVDSVLWDAVLRAPDDYFIVKISLNPYRTWHEDFPLDAAQDKDGEYSTSRHDRFAPPDYWSDEYREQAYHFVKTLVEHIHSQPYGKAVIGYFVGGGEDGQFYWQVGRETIQDGNAPGSLSLFRRWLRERYPTLEELRTAWGDPTLTYETALPPIKNEKYPGSFMDPAEHRKEVDFMTYLNEELARFLLENARIIKETAPKEVIVGGYYGRGASMSVYPMFAQTKVMLQSDLFDFMGAQPGYYGWREAGSEGHINWVFDSVRKHGKIMMTELDFRTWMGNLRDLADDFHHARYWNLEELTGAAARDIGKLFSVMGGAWWMEMTGGWFHHDDIMDMIGHLHDVAQQLYEKDPVITPADIVFIADEDSYFWSTEQFNIRQARLTHALNVQQRAINRAGLKYDFYYLDDVIADEMVDYKVYVFLNQYYVTDELRQFIDTHLKKDGKVIVWQYAPGYVTPEEWSLESMETLTGIKMGTDNGHVAAKFANAFDLDLSAEQARTVKMLLADIEGKSVGLGLGPATQRFYVDDPEAIPLAYYTDDGRVAAAVKFMDGYTSIYMGHPSGFTPDWLANIAKVFDVHTYMEPVGEMFMHHRDDFIVIHGVEGGQRILRLPYKAKVTDLLNDRVLMQEGNEVVVQLEPTETLWLHVERLEQ